MKTCRITVVKTAFYPDLAARYENPITHACDMREGQVFLSRGGEIPAGFCASAWQNLQPFVFALANGAENLYDGWMRDPRSAVISCNDGIRPVSVLLEALNE